MNKEYHLKKLDRLYKDWVLHSKFHFIPSNSLLNNTKPMEIEEFMSENYEQLTHDQYFFLRSLINVTAHVQNFEEDEQ